MKDLVLLRDLEDAGPVPRCEDVRAFTIAHFNNENDSAPVMIFADWLEERGYAKPAERLRVYNQHFVEKPFNRHRCLKCSRTTKLADGKYHIIPFATDKNDDCKCRSFEHNTYLLCDKGMAKESESKSYHIRYSIRNCCYAFTAFSDPAFMYFQYVDWFNENKTSNQTAGMYIENVGSVEDYKKKYHLVSQMHLEHSSAYIFFTRFGFVQMEINTLLPPELRQVCRIILPTVLQFDFYLKSVSKGNHE